MSDEDKHPLAVGDDCIKWVEYFLIWDLRPQMMEELMQRSREELCMPLKLLVLMFFKKFHQSIGLCIGPVSYQFCYMVASVGHPCVGSLTVSIIGV